MQLSINQNLKSSYPDLKVSVFEAKTKSKLELNQDLITKKRELEKMIRESYKDTERLDRIIKYNAFYKKFDSKVPMEFQIKSVIENKEIPLVNSVVTCMFMAELKNIILTAGHDTGRLGEKIRVSCSDGTDEYVKINGKQQKLKKGDIFASDNNGIISSVFYGPDLRTKITDGTKNFMFMCYCPFSISDNEIRGHMQDIVDYLKILGENKLEFGDIEVFNVKK
ncbi:MAG: hypothetical protein J4428_03870 [Candidatus Aenigmarchaeota archaeon]|nr:hypothetical protein [Candidatus Aenigmarchaeota archaeon]